MIKSVFTIKDAKWILGTAPHSVWNVIYRLKKKGKIEEMEKENALSTACYTLNTLKWDISDNFTMIFIKYYALYF